MYSNAEGTFNFKKRERIQEEPKGLTARIYEWLPEKSYRK